MAHSIRPSNLATRQPCHSVQGRGRLSSRHVAHEWGSMDELAAAAAVVIMAMDGFAGQHVGQRGSCGTDNDNDAAMPDVESRTEDKENNSVYAAGGNPEDAPAKVLISP